MRYALLTVLPLALVLSACGNDSGQQAAAPAAPEESTEPAAAAGSNEPASAAVTEAAAPMVASESTAAPIADDEVIYDPIDISKLQSTWWQQFSQ